MQELVVRGPYEHPGALYVIKDGIREDLRYVNYLRDIHTIADDTTVKAIHDMDTIQIVGGTVKGCFRTTTK